MLRLHVDRQLEDQIATESAIVGQGQMEEMAAHAAYRAATEKRMMGLIRLQPEHQDNTQ